jgi:hypothetical protein
MRMMIAFIFLVPCMKCLQPAGRDRLFDGGCEIEIGVVQGSAGPGVADAGSRQCSGSPERMRTDADRCGAHAQAIAPDHGALRLVQIDVEFLRRIRLVLQPDVRDRPDTAVKREARHHPESRCTQAVCIEPGECDAAERHCVSRHRRDMHRPFETCHIGQIGQLAHRLEAVEKIGKVEP